VISAIAIVAPVGDLGGIRTFIANEARVAFRLQRTGLSPEIRKRIRELGPALLN